jgi:hypothetical protein
MTTPALPCPPVPPQTVAAAAAAAPVASLKTATTTAAPIWRASLKASRASRALSPPTANTTKTVMIHFVRRMLYACFVFVYMLRLLICSGLAMLLCYSFKKGRLLYRLRGVNLSVSSYDLVNQINIQSFVQYPLLLHTAYTRQSSTYCNINFLSADTASTLLCHPNYSGAFFA